MCVCVCMSRSLLCCAVLCVVANTFMMGRRSVIIFYIFNRIWNIEAEHIFGYSTLCYIYICIYRLDSNTHRLYSFYCFFFFSRCRSRSLSHTRCKSLDCVRSFLYISIIHFHFIQRSYILLLLLLLLLALTVAVVVEMVLLVVVVLRCVAENTKCEEGRKKLCTRYIARMEKDEEN